VNAVVMGSFIKFKGDMWLGARLVKVETGEILATDDVKGDADAFFELVEKLSAKSCEGGQRQYHGSPVRRGPRRNHWMR